MTRRALQAVLVAAIAATLSGCSYNTFVSQEEAIKSQWAQVENQLQRRNDLIPEPGRDREGLRRARKRRVRGGRRLAREAGRRQDARGQDCRGQRRRSSALARLLAVVENYPQLKANEQFNRLSDELAGTENRIAVERKRYNEKVQDYNTKRRKFPSNVTATVFRFKEYPYFQAPAEAKPVPKVEFGK